MPTPRTVPSGNCLGAVSYPDIPVWELNPLLPIGPVAEDYVQVEYAIARGPGVCVPSKANIAPPAVCTVLSGESAVTLDRMLGTTTDDITEAEFASGARAMVTELVSGKLADGVSSFQYRMTAYSYEFAGEARKSPLLDRVSSCDGIRDETGSGDRRYVAVDQGDTHLIATHVASTVVLIEAIDQIAPDGSRSTIPTTASGRLPTAAFRAIEEWFVPRAAEVLATKTQSA